MLITKDIISAVKPPSKSALVALVAVVAAILVPGVAAAQGCAMCSTVGNGADDPLVQGMFRSILLMVSMPFVLLAAVGGWLYQHHRRDALGVLSSEEMSSDEPTRVIEFRRP